MPPNIRQIEEGKMSRLSQARNIAKLGKDAFDASHGSPKAILSLGKRFGKHWPIIAIAALFDLFALIPFVSVVQRITRELGVLVDKLRILGVEQLPLLLRAKHLEPVSAQPVSDRPVPEEHEQRAHFVGTRVLEPQLHPPVIDIRFEHVSAERFRGALEPDGVADPERLARGKEIIILARGVRDSGQQQGCEERGKMSEHRP